MAAIDVLDAALIDVCTGVAALARQMPAETIEHDDAEKAERSATGPRCS